MDTVHIKGLDDLVRKLRALPVKIARKAFGSGVSAAAKLIQDDYRARINNRTGTLRRSVVRKFIREESNDQQVVYYVLPRKGKKLRRTGKKGNNLSADAYYASWVEFGHWSRPAGKHQMARRATSYSVHRKGDWLFNSLSRAKDRSATLARMAAAGKIRQIPGKRWLTQSFEAKKNAAIDVMKNKIADNLRKLPEFQP